MSLDLREFGFSPHLTINLLTNNNTLNIWTRVNVGDFFPLNLCICMISKSRAKTEVTCSCRDRGLGAGDAAVDSSP